MWPCCCGAVVAAVFLAEVNPAGEFPDNHNVDAVQQLFFDWRRTAQLRVRCHRAQIRKHIQRCPQVQQAAFGPQFSDADVVRLREARRALGQDINYLRIFACQIMKSLRTLSLSKSKLTS